MSDNILIQALESLTRALFNEIIDGHKVVEAAEDVMLDVEASPIIIDPVQPNFWLFERFVPVPTKVWGCQGGGAAYNNPRTKYPVRLEEKQHKIMRARYLLVRGFFAPRMHALDHRTQATVTELYFPNGHFIPKMMERRLPKPELPKAAETGRVWNGVRID